MPTLTYSSADFPFQKFTKIYSTDVNQCFTDIRTLLNTTKLDASNIQNNAITTALIANGAVGQAQRAALGQQVSASSSTGTISGAGAAAIPNLSVTLTTTGRLVYIGLMDDGSGSGSNLSGTGGSGMQIQFFRGSTQLTATTLVLNSAYAPHSFAFYEAPAAGTYTYTAKVNIVISGTFSYNNLKLIAFEL